MWGSVSVVTTVLRRERATSKEKPVGAVRDLKALPVGDSMAGEGPAHTAGRP